MVTDWTLPVAVIGAGIIGIGFLAWKFGWFKKGPSVIQVDRTPHERKKRVEDLKLNGKTIKETVLNKAGETVMESYNSYNLLYHGDRLLGAIRSIAERETDSARLYEIIFQPPWKSWRGIGLYILTESQPILVGDNVLIKNAYNHRLTIRPEASIDRESAWFYDNSNERTHLNLIHDQIHKTDFESLGNMYFAEGQKKASIPTEYGKELAMEELKLQQEKAKRDKLISG